MKVFISYRRADSQATAGRLAQYLDAIPAVDEVFLDVDDIALGENFERRIEDTLARATHVFVLIGSQWPGTAGLSGQPRLFDADDVVRHETRLALASKLIVVPILIDATPMPRAADLPTDLRAMPMLNAFSLRTAHFDEDIDNLLDALLGVRGARVSRWRLPPLTPVAMLARALAGLVGGGAVLLGIGLANRYLSSDCFDLVCTIQQALGLDSAADALALLWLIAGGILALGLMAPFVPRLLRRWRSSR